MPELRWPLSGSGLGVAWGIANDAIIAEGKRGLIDDPVRFDGVTVPGVDEHCWGHTRGGAARTHRLTHGTLHDEVHLAPHDVPHGGTFCHSSTRTGASSRVSRCGPARRVLAGPGGQTPAPFYAW